MRMTITIKRDCVYIDQSYKKGEVITVKRRIGEVLCLLDYAEERNEEDVFSEKKDDKVQKRKNKP